MTPGPTEASERVLAAMMRPAVYHYDPRFVETFIETTELLEAIFQTRNNIVLIPGSGRVGLETSVLSVTEPKDKVLTVISGVFSTWFRDMVLRHGGTPIVLASEWGMPIDVAKIEAALDDDPDIKAVTMVHNETSTAAVNPIEEVGDVVMKHDAVFIVDTVSSMGGIEVRTDDWHIDLCATAPQKAIGALLGVAIVAVSEKAWKAMEARQQPAASYAFDLLKWKQTWFAKERGGLLLKGRRSFPVLPPTHTIFALNEACKIILEEGLETRFQRHRIAGSAVREGLRALSLNLFADPVIASNTVTCIRNPRGIQDAEVRRRLLAEHGIMIAGGMGELSGTTMRIGHMGNTATPSCVLPTLLALEHVLGELGHHLEPGAGVEAASRVFSGRRT